MSLCSKLLFFLSFLFLKDGNEVYAVTSISPIKNEEGNIRYFVTVREDITDTQNHFKLGLSR